MEFFEILLLNSSYDSGENEAVCENWSQGSWLMSWYNFWAQIAVNRFLGPRTQMSHTIVDACIARMFIFLFFNKDAALIR